MKRSQVIGGYSFIETNLAYILEKIDQDIKILDDLTKGSNIDSQGSFDSYPLSTWQEMSMVLRLIKKRMKGVKHYAEIKRAIELLNYSDRVDIGKDIVETTENSLNKSLYIGAFRI